MEYVQFCEARRIEQTKENIARQEEYDLSIFVEEESPSLIIIVFYIHVPIQRGSAIKANLLLGPTSIQSFPSLTTGQDFLHSWLHFLGLHLEALRIAIRVSESSPLSLLLLDFFLGGMVN